jgi:antitoxin VapB
VPALSLNIKDAETDLLVRRLVGLTGERITDAVRIAVQDRLNRELRRRDRGEVDRISQIVRAYRRKPVVDPRPADDLLYDDDGMPA